MTQGPADICVIIPACNAERTIRRAVRSALAEPEAAEVLVIDDGSTDGTAALAQSCDDGSGRLRVRSLPRSGGPAAARNLAIDESRSPWIALLDADDYFLLGRLGRMRRRASDCDLIADDLLCVLEGDSEGPFRPMIGGVASGSALTFAAFVRANISRHGRPRAELGFLKPLMRRAFLDAHALRYDPTLRLGEDFILYATALALGARFRLIDGCGYVSVQRSDSLSSRHSCADLKNLVEADRALGALKLSPRDAAALRAHRHHVEGKAQLRAVLDEKRAHGAIRGGLMMLASPSTVPYVVTRALIDFVKYGRVPFANRPKPAAPSTAMIDCSTPPYRIERPTWAERKLAES